MTDQTLINYFTQIDSREGLFLWMCMLVAFLIGFIIAYLLRSGKVRRLKKELAEARQQLEANQTLLTSAQDQLKQRNAELQEESREKVDLMERVRGVDTQKDQQLQEVVMLNQRLEEIQAANRNYSLTIDDLNNQIAELKTQNAQLLETPQNFVDTKTTTVVPSQEVAELRERLNTFETSLSRLSGENQALRSDLAMLKTQPTVETAVEAEDGELVLGNDKTVLYDKIIVSDRDKDALTNIEGIGDFLEKKLNSIGVFSYEDIANWTPGRIDEVTGKIGYIPGRIEKDDWVGQAALLLQKELQTPAPTATATAEAAKGKKATDLKIIEGIGPKIEEVLKDAGIEDWSALAAAEPGNLKDILEEAGDQYRMHNPYTWPLQARLAAAGRWDEFKTYQEELKGGKE
ncbi:helix-hairpin-helix domain-containing protein [Lewinella cohaerens]|uniref:helix-hairpin-helix domain-containing protein n=1 Tax=Lewinella cohaerens TaxID=70995 RepID=UPI00035F3B28|nr:helix-hairpin-helix domain-containing protein [Lewinella cohaerens]